MTRTNIDIDDELITKAIEITGKRTKKAAIEEALRRIVRNEELRQAIEDMRGLGWDAPPMQDRHFREDGTVYYDDDEK